jgi:hypothetical protein
MEKTKPLRFRIFDIVTDKNNPIDGTEILNEDKIKAVLLSRKTIKRWAYILHDKDCYTSKEIESLKKNYPAIERYKTISPGDQKNPHWHIEIELKNSPLEIDTIAAWFGVKPNYVNVPKGRGAFIDCVTYITHESEAQQRKGKYQYPDEEVHANFDFRDEINKATIKLLDKKNPSAAEKMQRDVLIEGKTLKQCIDEDEYTYMKVDTKLKRFRLQYLDSMDPPKMRINFYISGAGRGGKGLMSMAIARSLFPEITDDEELFFCVGHEKTLFEGYDGQPVIIWDDFRSDDLLRALGGKGNVFKVFDIYPKKIRQQKKNSFINLVNKVNIVNSVQSYEDFLDGLAGQYVHPDGRFEKAEFEDKQQSYGRFPFIIPLHFEDFDLLINRGFVDNSNAFQEYYMHLGLCGNLRKIHAICKENEELAKRIDAMTIQPVIDETKKYIEDTKSETLDEAAILEMFKDNGKTKEQINKEKLEQEGYVFNGYEDYKTTKIDQAAEIKREIIRYQKYTAELQMKLDKLLKKEA